MRILGCCDRLPIEGADGACGQNSRALSHEHELRLQPVSSNTTISSRLRRLCPVGFFRRASAAARLACISFIQPVTSHASSFGSTSSSRRFTVAHLNPGTRADRAAVRACSS